MSLNLLRNALLLVALGLAPSILLLTNTLFQLFVVVFGALFVFQASDSVDMRKLIYLCALGLVTVLSLRERESAISRRSLITGVVLLSLSFVSLGRGREAMWVVRDMSNYFLLIAAGLLAMHFGNRLSERAIIRIATGAAGLGTYSFLARWSSNRGFASLPVVGLASSMLVTLAVSMASAMATGSRRSVRWWAVAGGVIAAGLATGTRNMLFLALSPMAVVAVAGRGTEPIVRRRARRRSLLAVVALPTFLGVSLLGVRAIGVDVDGALERVLTVTDVGTSNASRASLDERRVQQQVAWAGFLKAPVLGQGPGTIWVSQRTTSRTVSRSITADTSMLVPAKWGIVGSAFLCWLLAGWWVLLRPRRDALSIWGLTTVGVAPVFLAQSLLTPVLEDRGLPLALVLLGAGTIANLRLRGDPNCWPPGQFGRQDSLPFKA